MGLSQQGPLNPLIGEEAFDASVPTLLAGVLQETLTRHHVRLTDAGERFICLYGAVAVRRVSEGYPLADFSAEDVAQNVRDAARELANTMQQLAGKLLLRRKKVAVRPPCRPPCRTSIRAPSAPTTMKRW